jgi:TonB family protein
MAIAAEMDETVSVHEALQWASGGIAIFARSVVADFWISRMRSKEIHMSKRKLAVLALGLALAAVIGWTVEVYWLTRPASAQMIAYGVEHHAPGERAMRLSLGEGVHPAARSNSRGPEPISIPAPPYRLLATKDGAKGDVEVLLDVNGRGNVVGVREIYSSSVNDAGLAKSVLDIAQTWKFKPALQKGEPVPAMVVVQVKF